MGKDIFRNLLGTALIIPLVVRIMMDWPYQLLALEELVDITFLLMAIIGLCMLFWGRDRKKEVKE